MASISRLGVVGHKRQQAFVLAAAVLLIALAAPASADLVVSTDTSATDVVASIADEMVEGDEMGGMLVTVTFGGLGAPGPDADVWSATGAGAGSATSNAVAGWSLTQSGDSYSLGGPTWTFTNSTGFAVTGLEINAEVGAIAFDLGLPPVVLGVPIGIGTTGTLFGLSFDADTSDDSLSGTATYSRQIATTANHGGVPQGDLFGILTLAITGGGMPSGTVLTFTADTDMLSQAVPEASQMIAFVAVGLVSGGAVYLRKRHIAQAV
jgi:hypothetical protein